MIKFIYITVVFAFLTSTTLAQFDIMEFIKDMQANDNNFTTSLKLLANETVNLKQNGKGDKAQDLANLIYSTDEFGKNETSFIVNLTIYNLKQSGMEEEAKDILKEIGNDLPTSEDLISMAIYLVNDADIIINKFSKRKSLSKEIPTFISVMKTYRKHLINFKSNFK
jgi:hypothetical protein